MRAQLEMIIKEGRGGGYGHTHSVINGVNGGVNNTFGASVQHPLYATFRDGSDNDAESHMTGSRSTMIR